MSVVYSPKLWTSTQTDTGWRLVRAGVPGVPGPKGDKGDTGDAGAAGAPGPNLITPFTSVSNIDNNSLLANVGGFVAGVSMNAYATADAVSASMAAHVANVDPHTQYALDADLAGYSVVGHTHAASAIVSGTLADARLSSNIPLLNATTNTFTGTQNVAKVLIPPQVTGATNPLTIRANTGGVFTEPIFYVGVQGSETSSGIAFRSNGATQLPGGAAVGQFNDIQLGGAGTAAFGLARGTAQSFNLGGTGNFTFDAGSGAGNTSFDIVHSAKSSTTAGRSVARALKSFSVPTDATRSGQIEEFVATYAGNVRVARLYAENLNPFRPFSVSATAPTDASLQPSELVFYTDGSGQLKIKLKDASGTVRSGTVTLT